jgi:hypothetical protein
MGCAFSRTFPRLCGAVAPIPFVPFRCAHSFILWIGDTIALVTPPIPALYCPTFTSVERRPLNGRTPQSGGLPGLDPFRVWSLPQSGQTDADPLPSPSSHLAGEVSAAGGLPGPWTAFRCTAWPGGHANLIGPPCTATQGSRLCAGVVPASAANYGVWDLYASPADGAHYCKWAINVATWLEPSTLQLSFKTCGGYPHPNTWWLAPAEPQVAPKQNTSNEGTKAWPLRY